MQITLTEDMITHESFRLSWTPDGNDLIELQRDDGIWISLDLTGENNMSPFVVTTANSRLTPGAFARARTTPLPVRIRNRGTDTDLLEDGDDFFSNVVMITILPDPNLPQTPDPVDPPIPETPTEEMAGDSDAVVAEVLPNVLRGITNGTHSGIFNRIQQRQREDGKWK